MLGIVHLEEIESLLLKLPLLAQQQEQRNSEFPARVRDWLAELEKVFVANRLHQAGGIAAIRSALIAADQGQVPADVKFRGRPTRSRVLNTVASQCLQQAAAMSTALAGEHRTRITEAERIARQVVAAAVSRNLVPCAPDQRDATHYLRSLRQSLASSNDLEAAIVHVEGLVGPNDLLVLLDRALAHHLRTAS
jgi:hypothetical protein